MLIFFIILSVGLLLLCVFLWAKLHMTNHCLDWFIDAWTEKGIEYEALETGRDEESEAYEQQFLSFTEEIEQLQDMLVRTIPLTQAHERYCLPWVARMDLIEIDVTKYDDEEPETPIFDSVIIDRTG